MPARRLDDRIRRRSSSPAIRFRAIRRGRQLFQRKFTQEQGQGPVSGDGHGDMNVNLAIGAGLADSCAGCHGRPRGSAGAGGNVATRPDSRDAPHLFGLGLKEMLADEITTDLRALRTQASVHAQATKAPVTVVLASKGIHYGALTVLPDGSFDTSRGAGIDPDLRVRPFFAHGGKISMREFIVGALNDEMGLQAVDPELAAAQEGGRFVTPAGMVLDGRLDRLDAPPATGAEDPDADGVVNEIPRSLVDYLEFYLLNYFKPATYRATTSSAKGRQLFDPDRLRKLPHRRSADTPRPTRLFPPDDTASNLNPGDRNTAGFPQYGGHGSIKLTGLFNDPGDPE